MMVGGESCSMVSRLKSVQSSMHADGQSSRHPSRMLCRWVSPSAMIMMRVGSKGSIVKPVLGDGREPSRDQPMVDMVDDVYKSEHTSCICSFVAIFLASNY